jgi:hypothetical protein
VLERALHGGIRLGITHQPLQFRPAHGKQPLGLSPCQGDPRCARFRRSHNGTVVQPMPHQSHP